MNFQLFATIWKGRCAHVLGFGMLLSLTAKTAQATVLRYFPIGDSYTIGSSIALRDNFPTQLAQRLSHARQKVHVISNLSQIGWTSGDAVQRELPAFEAAKPEFATLLIGVNDWVQGVPLPVFTKNLRQLLDRMIVVLPNPRRLLVLTVPDFSAAPSGASYGRGRNISQGISEMNRVIRAEALKRGLYCVDLFKLSQRAAGRQELFAADGLHPSGRQYAQWVKAMLPQARKALGRN